jgi:hypothetical protein
MAAPFFMPGFAGLVTPSPAQPPPGREGVLSGVGDSLAGEGATPRTCSRRRPG